MLDLPSFDELPEIPGLGLRHAWGVFGENDRLGSMNLLSPESVVSAAALVKTGETISLDLPLDVPNPPFFGRQPYVHEVFPLNRNEMDDRVQNFHLQGSTQWDALGHVRCREHGYWGGRISDPTSTANELGIDRWAERGVVGRGILIDVAGWAEAVGRPFHAFTPLPIADSDLVSVLEFQKVSLEPGDILCIRMGWVGEYRRLDAGGRIAYAESPEFAGLAADEAMARFLWNAHPAAVVCDNPAVEVVPSDPAVGSLHRRLIPLLGMALGEMFDFETLAKRCREQQRWTFLFSASPLNVPGGLGSPGNALAIL
jgi:hypothetical protein